ncbi:MAG TPA: hypothetical protein VJW20_02045 [Candidatus Angelobacter sp.]|nr:hypothetical protein [Candidatus Angelobacter sp.]
MTITHDVLFTGGGSLSSLGIHCEGLGVRIAARRLKVESNVVLSGNVTLAGDEIEIGDGVMIGEGCDLRSQSLTIGARSAIHAGVRLFVAERCSMGHAGRILDQVSITCRSFEAGDLLFLGDHLQVGGGGNYASTSRVRIGHRVALGSYTMLNANRLIELEDQVGSGDYLSVWTHGFHFGHSVLEGFGATYDPVHIERNVWLAHHVTVLPGVRIGENTIVAACSVVTKSLPAGVLAAGAPAQVRKSLNPQPLDDQAAETALSAILHKWFQELEWKGWTVQTGPNGFTELLSGGSRVYCQLLPSGTYALDNCPGEQGILISLRANKELIESLPPGWSLLEIRPGAFHGSSFDVSEDLRDFLRRNSIPCGSENLFQSIMPSSFQRLQSLI